jgi:MoaA/NifB/PqqE/SkfB family radical SAM enzyme
MTIKNTAAARPKTAVVAITDRCNSRCTFCKIWQRESAVDLDEKLIDKLPLSIKEVNITGGEPFLHGNLEKIVEKLCDRNCVVIINTNGLVPINRRYSFLKRNRVGIRFSLDGIGQLHDELRGIPGNFKKVIGQIDALQSIGFNNIGIVSTFSDQNWRALRPLYKLSRDMKIGFTCAIAANSEVYYRTTANRFREAASFTSELRHVIGREMLSLKVKGIGKALFMKELCRFAVTPAKLLRCSAGNSFFFLSATGDVFTCNMRNLHIGNLSTNSFEDLWRCEAAGRARAIASRCSQPCWTMCNAKQILKEHIVYYSFKFLTPIGGSNA